jgi:hypothetical protein
LVPRRRSRSRIFSWPGSPYKSASTAEASNTTVLASD